MNNQKRKNNMGAGYYLSKLQLEVEDLEDRIKDLKCNLTRERNLKNKIPCIGDSLGDGTVLAVVEGYNIEPYNSDELTPRKYTAEDVPVIVFTVSRKEEKK